VDLGSIWPCSPRACNATPTRPDELDGLLGLGGSALLGSGGWLLGGLSLGACAHPTEQEGYQHGDTDRDRLAPG
jgi:hypothetical protein